MCGIFTLLNIDNKDTSKHSVITKQFYKGQRRGPEHSCINFSYAKTVIGFHRLAINGINDLSNQPIFYKGVVLICNGEIYNYKQLYRLMRSTPVTDSDCEVILHLYLQYGIEQTLRMLDGVYAFALYDFRDEEPESRVFFARDPFGVRPLYQLYNQNNNENNLLNLYGVASELKCLEYFYNTNIHNYSLGQFKPGTYSLFSFGHTSWRPIVTNRPHFLPAFSDSYALPSQIHDSLYYPNIKTISTLLNLAVEKRCATTERPVACLLSGGLDSSLIAALVANYFDKHKPRQPPMETYSIGLENSEDIVYARKVAKYIGSNHTEVIFTEQEFFEAIPEVIQAIESYDITTVRASIGNYLLGKYIASHSSAKVIFNGDGSDELFGGYLYMNLCPDDIEFDKETRRLLEDIHLFDVLRSDKSISSNGLEPRTPFLDKTFVNHVLSISPYWRNHRNNGGCMEKQLLRQSFEETLFFNHQGQSILPKEILWRKKEAFSDGVSSQQRSLFTILQEQIADHFQDDGLLVMPSIGVEKEYYKKIFNQYFPNCEHILPYYWMPKYTTNVFDPSARMLPQVLN